MEQPADTFKTFAEICMEAGYEVESHYVLTEDQYINQMFRVYDPRYTDLKGAVLLLHGFSDSSDNFIINDKARAPAFMLANQGYDVWLGNLRGNSYSKGHMTLNSDTDLEYWAGATLYQQGLFDVPAFIEAALAMSRFEKLTVISHSFGSV